MLLNLTLPASAQFGIDYLKSSTSLIPGTILFDSKRGDNHAHLHSQVDGHPIFLVAETSIGETFAGYQSSFSSVGGWKADDQAWFALCQMGSVYIANPDDREGNHVYHNTEFGPTWGTGFSFSIGYVSKLQPPYKNALCKPCKSYKLTKGPALQKGYCLFNITSVMIFEAVVAKLSFKRLRLCNWNHDEVEAYTAMVEKTTPDDVFPPPITLSQPAKPEDLNQMMQQGVLRTLVIPTENDIGSWNLTASCIGRVKVKSNPVAMPSFVSVLSNMMPCASCVEYARVDNEEDVVGLSKLLQCAPSTVTHIEILDVSNLTENALSVFACPLTVGHHIEVYFGNLPTKMINPEVYIRMATSNPNVTFYWNKQIPNEFPTIPSFPDIELRVPLNVDDLKKDKDIGFLVRSKEPGSRGIATTTSFCVPCRRDVAQKYCKLFTDMEWGDNEGFVCSSDPDVIPSSSNVQLLVAYLETIATESISNDIDETTYCMTTREENFVTFMFPRLNEDHVSVLRCVSQLLTFASYLNIPSLRRLLRSIVLKQSMKHPDFMLLIGEGNDSTIRLSKANHQVVEVEVNPAKRRKT
eukprot:PhF_6_TR39640/c0_g1_i1/m.58772